MDDKDKPSDEKGLAKRGTQDLILPEVLEAMKQGGARVDVNVLLVQISQKSSSVEEMVAYSEKALELAERFEEQKVENFKRMADAIINVKERDPDEVQKRKNNGIRRGLKIVVACLGGVGLVGSLTVASMQGNMLVATMLGAIGMMAIALLGPLASGESVSSNDVVRIFGAMKDIVSFKPGRIEEPQPPERGRKKK